MEDKELFEITARSVIVEVTDEKTGEVFRRELPIDFYENANLLRLSGENLDGSTSQLGKREPAAPERRESGREHIPARLLLRAGAGAHPRSHRQGL